MLALAPKKPLRLCVSVVKTSANLLYTLMIRQENPYEPTENRY
jgi:hypothetical protein